MSNVIIEGVDRLGKGTLIEGIQQRIGACVIVHYEKPKLLRHYLNVAEQLLSSSDTVIYRGADARKLALELYQKDSFMHMFHMLNNVHMGLILDRAHLGEMVYAKRYRGYDGSFVLEYEQKFGDKSLLKDQLVLLVSTDHSFVQDDGLSFDHAKRAEEQQDFVNAFNASGYKNKLMVDVCLYSDATGWSLGRYADADLICDTVMSNTLDGVSRRVRFLESEDGSQRALFG